MRSRSGDRLRAAIVERGGADLTLPLLLLAALVALVFAARAVHRSFKADPPA